MIKVERVEVWGFEHAIRGMRNPKNSWEKSDSEWDGDFYVGPNDMKLMQTLFKGGTEHRKYLRQIFVSMDITAPLYWWKEFDTYKVGTVANSCSTMHKIHAKEFEPIDFSIGHLNAESYGVFNTILAGLNVARENYLQSKDKNDWWQMIQLLPTSFNQKRTITMNYENVFSMIHQRSAHKLDEWREFVSILSMLPYVEQLAEGSEDGTKTR